MKKKVMYQGRQYVQFESGALVPLSVLEKKPLVKTAEDVLPILEDIRFQEQEHFKVIHLDSAGQVVFSSIVSKGLVNQAPVHPREVFKEAIRRNASSIILAHNHPSGSLTPSEADLTITEKLVEAGKLLNIPVLDHVIVSSQGFVSLLESQRRLF